MAKKWSNEDIEAAISAAFSQLGYPVVKAEQLEAAREFMKHQDVFVLILTSSGSCYATDALTLCCCRLGMGLSSWRCSHNIRTKSLKCSFTYSLHLQLPLPLSHRHATSHGVLLYQLYHTLLSRFFPLTFLMGE